MQILPKLGNKRGLSAIEVLIMLLLVSLILVAVPAAFKRGTQLWDESNRHDKVMKNALTGMKQITYELRQAKEIRAVSASHDPIGFIDFKCEYDIDGDGDVIDSSGNAEYKYQRYEYRENYLQHAWSDDRSADLSSILEPLAGPLNNLTFTCYKEFEQPVTIPDEMDHIRSINIKMITYDDAGRVNPIPLSSRIYLRSWVQCHVTDNFAIVGDDGVSLGDQDIYVGFSVDPSNIGANADVYVGQHTTVNGETHRGTGSNLVLSDDRSDIHLGPDYGCDEIILMPCVTDFDDFQWWSGQPVPPDAGTDISLAHNEERDIAPGVYGALDIADDAILNLSSGTYRFSSITGQNDVTIKIDVSCGDVRIFVDGCVVLGNKLDFTTTLVELVDGGGAEHVYFETHYVQNYSANSPDAPAWTMGRNALWYGSVYAPYGGIEVTDGVINGQLISGGSVNIHGGNPARIETPVSSTIVDYVLSNHLSAYGYNCVD